MTQVHLGDDEKHQWPLSYPPAYNSLNTPHQHSSCCSTYASKRYSCGYTCTAVVVHVHCTAVVIHVQLWLYMYIVQL